MMKLNDFLFGGCPTAERWKFIGEYFNMRTNKYD